MIIIRRPGAATPPNRAATAQPKSSTKPTDDAAEPARATIKPPAGAPSEPPDDAPAGGEGPKHPGRDTRFQPGQSGNPKGRPKNSRSLAEELRRAVQKRVPGSRLKFLQLLVQQLTYQGGKGSLKAIELCAKLLDQGSVNEAKHKPTTEPLPLDDDAYQRIYENLGRSLGKSDPKES